jgi:hypothetical protein
MRIAIYKNVVQIVRDCRILNSGGKCKYESAVISEELIDYEINYINARARGGRGHSRHGWLYQRLV